MLCTCKPRRAIIADVVLLIFGVSYIQVDTVKARVTPKTREMADLSTLSYMKVWKLNRTEQVTMIVGVCIQLKEHLIGMGIPKDQVDKCPGKPRLLHLHKTWCESQGAHPAHSVFV